MLALTAGDLTQQVGALLIDEVKGEPGQVELSQSTIAELLGSTRPSINRVLRGFAARGHVRLGFRRIEVIDPAGLHASLD